MNTRTHEHLNTRVSRLLALTIGGLLLLAGLVVTGLYLLWSPHAGVPIAEERDIPHPAGLISQL